ncbi:AAA family ATPase, partial [Candidatus Riflebacteria bacterium]
LYSGKAGDAFLDRIQAVLSTEKLDVERDEYNRVHVSEKLINYLHCVVDLSRKDNTIALGISPRGAQYWLRAAKTLAYFQHRDYLIPDDLLTVAKEVLAHRLLPVSGFEALIDKQIEVVENLLQKVPIPV